MLWENKYEFIKSKILLFSMETMVQKDIDTSKDVLIFARKNYKTYKNHFLSRNLKPISFDKFLENYKLK